MGLSTCVRVSRSDPLRMLIFHDFDKAEREHLLEENRKRKRQREAPQNSAVIE